MCIWLICILKPSPNQPNKPTHHTTTPTTQVPLLSQPGSKWRYAYGYDLLGVLLFKATGQSPDVWMKQVRGETEGWGV